MVCMFHVGRLDAICAWYVVKICSRLTCACSCTVLVTPGRPHHAEPQEGRGEARVRACARGAEVKQQGQGGQAYVQRSPGQARGPRHIHARPQRVEQERLERQEEPPNAMGPYATPGTVSSSSLREVAHVSLSARRVLLLGEPAAAVPRAAATAEPRSAGVPHATRGEGEGPAANATRS